MGEVYHARDGRRQRDVAIKIVRDLAAAGEDRLARFRREAQVLASLNHQHIGAIYGVEDIGGSRALVLELVEGPTLADRIARGRIPIDEAVSIARQIAEALAAAHDQGVIHRDLKPANGKLRPDGTVKVLDFGLAKVFTDDSGASEPFNSPTLSLGATHAGVIDTKAGEIDHLWPEALPGGRAVLFTVVAAGGVPNAQIAAVDLQTGTRKNLLRGGTNAVYLPTGHLLYSAGGSMRIVPFDAERLEVRGDPVPVPEPMTVSSVGGERFGLARRHPCVRARRRYERGRAVAYMGGPHRTRGADRHAGPAVCRAAHLSR